MLAPTLQPTVLFTGDLPSLPPTPPVVVADLGVSAGIRSTSRRRRLVLLVTAGWRRIPSRLSVPAAGVVPGAGAGAAGAGGAGDTTGAATESSTQRGAIIGGATGVAVGVMTSRDKVKGGAVGTVTGAVLGGVVGSPIATQPRSQRRN
jgi:hypothetical protein